MERAVASLRDRAPLVHGITGTATQGLVADGLLAAGARPMLTSTRAEAPTLVPIANALLVNLGSLNNDAREAIKPSVEAAVAHGIPWVLDPTAIGLAPVRTPLARELVALAPTAVRGNASEVLTLALGAGGGHVGRGADSTITPDAAVVAARDISRAHGCVVAVSGAVDLVTDGRQEVRVANGHPLLTQVSGTGCLLGALSAAMVGLDDVAGVVAVVAATALLTVASERAAANAAGPGSFRIRLLDELNAVSSGEVALRARLTCE
ncbi:hydroxyethylthiazole kinase [Knoellia sinensis KCTC 19936]|uniref:Hydroxyethylthiazole kinase n=1 Tax=Knoellia sinensis KCTC 19936 TaxID=1385520 RepID=A0A0A0J390_9MICO|nr:hydroxyethylthiazole kinase [Knoellia sinensis KCTC 19936]